MLCDQCGGKNGWFSYGEDGKHYCFKCFIHNRKIWPSDTDQLNASVIRRVEVKEAGGSMVTVNVIRRGCRNQYQWEIRTV